MQLSPSLYLTNGPLMCAKPSRNKCFYHHCCSCITVIRIIMTNALEKKQTNKQNNMGHGQIVALMFYVLLRGNQCYIHRNKQISMQRLGCKCMLIYSFHSHEQQMLSFCRSDKWRVVYLTQQGIRLLLFFVFFHYAFNGTSDCSLICFHELAFQTLQLGLLFPRLSLPAREETNFCTSWLICPPVLCGNETAIFKCCSLFSKTVNNAILS